MMNLKEITFAKWANWFIDKNTPVQTGVFARTCLKLLIRHCEEGVFTDEAISHSVFLGSLL
jgi:hypothetical protein